MRIIVTADDFGFTRGITDTILEAVDRGAINCVSIIANGDDFDRAIEEAKKRPDLQIALHLNLTDGTSLAPRERNPLIDVRGKFCLVFQTLWLRYFFSRRKPDFFLAAQNEITLQVQKIKAALPNRKIYLNGHDHVHLIPFVMRAVASVVDDLGVTYVRIPEEPLFFVRNKANVYCSAGLAKHLLLNLLSLYARKKLRRTHVETTDAFVGILFTGRMTVTVVQAAFKKILKRAAAPAIVEVLFHPGKANQSEATRWKHKGRSWVWFVSPERDAERQAAQSSELDIFLKSC